MKSIHSSHLRYYVHTVHFVYCFEHFQSVESAVLVEIKVPEVLGHQLRLVQTVQVHVVLADVGLHVSEIRRQRRRQLFFSLVNELFLVQLPGSDRC